ncbi:unnamed protein product [Mytilus edulis]|uniref:Uncharacterized protein n=1 Tax=Mytilus edulis TaxID=6550 RepID=A0A8S3R026_MYTED|nr:unnamed protein product [Mytilus edulis]
MSITLIAIPVEEENNEETCEENQQKTPKQKTPTYELPKSPTYELAKSPMYGENYTKRAELLLDSFYKCSKPLYVDATCGLNVQNISHIIKLVEDWGPLWTFSCFSFESIHGKGNVSGEVYWSVHSEKIIENKVKQLTDGKVKQLLQNILRHNRISSNDNYEIGDQCYVMKPLVKVLNIDESLKEQIADILNTTVDHLQTLSLFKAVKIRRNNFVFYSQSCGKVKQRNSYTALLHKEYKACDIVQI